MGRMERDEESNRGREKERIEGERESQYNKDMTHITKYADGFHYKSNSL